ncbi:cation:proton antiporter [Sporosarcina limicola]|uniref:Kef-type K+ transport system membrane component KefB n=1 Tax=Sporosarcina limicola TaxID=34101 RepID=A0A927R3S8_9BACL|nr:cation:proton antiporter [Sporosarcina limicola]MBE1555421.1 Kef-type K+ transport system membrane component KefB [Sporosarcina limicola]
MGQIELFLNITVGLIMIILLAQLFGSMAQKVGQPRVVGEMISGIFLGPTFFGYLLPDIQGQIFNNETISILFVLSIIALAFYMFIVGLEIDFSKLEKSVARHTFFLSIAGFFPAAITGFLVAFLLYGNFVVNSNSLVFSLFIGTAVAMTAFPMLTRILEEKGITHTKVGTLALFSASIIDVFCWILLAVVLALHKANGYGSVLFTFFGLLLLVIVGYFIIRPIIQWMITTKFQNAIKDNESLPPVLFATILSLILLYAISTEVLGLYAVFGGFVLGVCMPRKKLFQKKLIASMEPMVKVFLLPIFFAYSGLKTQFIGLMNPSIISIIIILTIACFISKYGACTLTMRAMGYSWRTSSSVGSLMNAKGLMELILANVGLSTGIISEEVFALLIIISVITTAAAMPLYNYSLTKESRILQKNGSKPTSLTQKN